MTYHVFPLETVKKDYGLEKVELSDIIQWLDANTISYNLHSLEFGELDNFAVWARTN
jgi:hypothetical protein